MKMRKLFLGLSLLAIAGMWTGCSNDEGVAIAPKGKAIEFRVQGGAPELRATATQTKDVDAFVVFGTDDAANTAGDPVILDGVTVARVAGTDYFDYSPKRYFTAGAVEARFAAYSPVSAKPAVSTAFTYTGGMELTYIVPKYVLASYDGTTVQEDLLVAVERMTSGLTASTYDAPNVTLDFQHALSRIFVKATSTFKETVTITGLTLRNLNTEGTLAIATMGTTPVWGVAGAIAPLGDGGRIWNTATTPDDYPYVLAEAGIAIPANTSTPILVTTMTQGMLVLPQVTVNAGDDVTTGDFALEVTYNVANLTGQKAYVYLPDGYEFQMNKQYAITIDFVSLFEINFGITVTPFEPIINIP